MTLQEIFDKVNFHLRSQNAKSLDEFGKCAYRGQDGRSCAVGCLIPDELYKPSMEYMVSDQIDGLSSIVGTQDYPEKLYLLRGLQLIHDIYPPEQWEHELRLLGIKFHLFYYDKA